MYLFFFLCSWARKYKTYMEIRTLYDFVKTMEIVKKIKKSRKKQYQILSTYKKKPRKYRKFNITYKRYTVREKEMKEGERKLVKKP